MRSSSGEYYERLDHVRALAAFLVFTWHFTHANALIEPATYVPAFPLASLLEEGHTGVALFMALTGYLFAKLIDGQPFSVRMFLWNRFVRLVPLLAVVLAVTFSIKVMRGAPLQDVVGEFLLGLILSNWPNGAWSVAVELHFYLVMPMVLWAVFRNAHWAVLLVFISMAVRAILFGIESETQSVAFYSIVGRFDQFVLGIWSFRALKNRKLTNGVFLVALPIFVFAFHHFNTMGGFFGTKHSPVWICLSTVEGLFYAVAIRCYDTSSLVLPSPLARIMRLIGTWSYSIYLWHFFIFQEAATLIHNHVIDLGTYGVSVVASIVVFLLFLPFARLSYRCMEEPFLRYRRSYKASNKQPTGTYATAAA